MPLGELVAADAIARVARAVESEVELSYALWAEDLGRTGPFVPSVRELHNRMVAQVQPGDIEVWQVVMDAVV